MSTAFEFGALVKSAFASGEKMADMEGAKFFGSNLGVLGGLTGGGIGAAGGLLSGAYEAPRGKKLRGALSGLLRGAGKGALLGGGTGLGFGAALGSYVPGKEIIDSVRAGVPISEEALNARMGNINPAEFAGVTTLGTLGGAGVGGLLGSALIGSGKKEEEEKPEEKSAFAFGVRVKLALDPAFIAPAAGAALGGLGGLVSSKKNRLRNALIGAGLGGAAGGAAEYALPGVGLAGKYTAQNLLGADAISKLKRAPEMLEYAARRHSTLPGLELFGVADRPSGASLGQALGDAANKVKETAQSGAEAAGAFIKERAQPQLDDVKARLNAAREAAKAEFQKVRELSPAELSRRFLEQSR